MPTPLEWLVMTGWPTIGELAGFSDVDRSTISRQLTGVDDDPQRLGWRRDGLVVSREAGRLLRPAERLLAGSKLLGEMFPRRHTHPAPDGHRHNPRLPRDYGHRHPNYFNGKQGAAFLFGRMEVIEVFYSLAPTLFQGKGAEWSPTGLPLKITGWRWLRYGRLVEAVATYEGGVKIGFCWVGQEVTGPMLRWRWENRFAREQYGLLVTLSSAEDLERERNRQVDPPDPDLDWNPHLSGYVIAVPDERAMEIAMEVLPRANFLRRNAFLFAVGPAGGTRTYLGRAEPVPDDVWDVCEDIDLGVPEELCKNPD